jgi:integrase
LAQSHRSPIDSFPPDTDQSGAAVGSGWAWRTTISTEVKTNSVSSRIAWNKGRLVGQKRSLRPNEVWAIRVRLQMKQRKRDLALFDLAIDSKLRGCDLVSLRVDDIATGGRVRDRATTILMEQTRAPLQEWLNARPADEAPTSSEPRPRPASPYGAPIRRIVRDWVGGVGMDSTAYGTHSLRRTKAAQYYRKTGNLRAVATSWTYEDREHGTLLLISTEN